MKSLLIEILIRLLLGNLHGGPREVMSKEVEDGMLAQMWDSPVFRKRIADRDARLVHEMAGGEGMRPEPRDAYALHAGQRVENLLLARDAKAAHGRMQKQRAENVVG